MKQTAVEWLDRQVDNELKVIDNLYGKEIIGRKIAFAFVKRILIEAKEIEDEQLNQAFQEGGIDAQSNYKHH
jgi:hypothetical protein